MAILWATGHDPWSWLHRTVTVIPALDIVRDDRGDTGVEATVPVDDHRVVIHHQLHAVAVGLLVVGAMDGEHRVEGLLREDLSIA